MDPDFYLSRSLRLSWNMLARGWMELLSNQQGDDSLLESGTAQQANFKTPAF